MTDDHMLDDQMPFPTPDIVGNPEPRCPCLLLLDTSGSMRGAKMDHSPATLIRPAPGAPWVRIGGFATADQLYAELPNLTTLHAAR